MNRLMTGSLAIVVLALLSTGSLLAHHSLANYNTTQAVRVKGTIVEVHRINPHSIIYLEDTSDGQTRRWAAEGPSLLQLSRTAGAKELPKPGDVVEICGYLPKEPIVWQIANPDPGGRSISGRLINAETLTTADGRMQSWGDYGVHKCFMPGYADQHSTR
jgi:hypothetical protein